MKIGSILLLSTLVVLTFANAAASVFLPKSMKVTQQGMRSLTNSESSTIGARHDLRWAIRQQQQQQQRRSSGTTAMAIPGYGVAEQVLVGGFANFLSIVRFWEGGGVDLVYATPQKVSSVSFLPFETKV